MAAQAASPVVSISCSAWARASRSAATSEPSSSPFLNSTVTLGPPAVLKTRVVTFFALPLALPLPLRVARVRSSISSRLRGGKGDGDNFC